MAIVVDHIRTTLQQTPSIRTSTLRRVFYECMEACRASGATAAVQHDGLCLLLFCAAELALGCPTVGSVLADVATDQLEHTMRQMRGPVRRSGDVDAENETSSCACAHFSAANFSTAVAPADRKAEKHVRRLHRLVSQLEEQWTESSRKRRRPDSVRRMFHTEDTQLAQTQSQFASADGTMSLEEWCLVEQLLNQCGHANATMCREAHRRYMSTMLSKQGTTYPGRLIIAARHACCVARMLFSNKDTSVKPTTSTLDVRCMSTLHQFARCAAMGAAQFQEATFGRLLERAREVVVHGSSEGVGVRHRSWFVDERITGAALTLLLWSVMVPQSCQAVVQHAVNMYCDVTSKLENFLSTSTPFKTTQRPMFQAAAVRACDWMCVLLTYHSYSVQDRQPQRHFRKSLKQTLELCESFTAEREVLTTLGRLARALLEVLAFRPALGKHPIIEQQVEQLLSVITEQRELRSQVPTRLFVYICVFVCPSAGHLLAEVAADRLTELAEHASDAGEQPSFFTWLATIAPVVAHYLERRLDASVDVQPAGVAYSTFTEGNAAALLRTHVKRRSSSCESWASLCDWEEESDEWPLPASMRTVPDTVYVQILSYMSFKRVARCASVNKTFNFAANYNGLWQNMYERRFPFRFESDCLTQGHHSALAQDLAKLADSKQWTLESAPDVFECINALAASTSTEESAATIHRLHAAMQTKPCTKCKCMQPTHTNASTTPCSKLFPLMNHDWKALFRVRGEAASSCCALESSWYA